MTHIRAKLQSQGVVTVGHIPREITRYVHYFLLKGGSVTGIVADVRHRLFPIPEGGLEIPIDRTFSICSKAILEKMKIVEAQITKMGEVLTFEDDEYADDEEIEEIIVQENTVENNDADVVDFAATITLNNQPPHDVIVIDDDDAEEEKEKCREELANNADDERGQKRTKMEVKKNKERRTKERPLERKFAWKYTNLCVHKWRKMRKTTLPFNHIHIFLFKEIEIKIILYFT